MINKKLIQDVYSTNEVRTNRVWIDGKTIYRQVINVNAISTTGNDNFISMGINSSSISQVVKIDGILNINIGALPVNFHNTNNQQYSMLVYVNFQQTTARIDVRNNYAISGGYVIVEYTKTTN